MKLSSALELVSTTSGQACSRTAYMLVSMHDGVHDRTSHVQAFVKSKCWFSEVSSSTYIVNVTGS